MTPLSGLVKKAVMDLIGGFDSHIIYNLRKAYLRLEYQQRDWEGGSNCTLKGFLQNWYFERFTLKVVLCKVSFKSGILKMVLCGIAKIFLPRLTQADLFLRCVGCWGSLFTDTTLVKPLMYSRNLYKIPFSDSDQSLDWIKFGRENAQHAVKYTILEPKQIIPGNIKV